MKTFAELKSMLTRDLTELETLEENRFTTIEQRHVKEQEIGALPHQKSDPMVRIYW
jgi:hypothetical protein